MNEIEKKLKTCIADAVKKGLDLDLELDEIVIEIPKDKSHGDYASNIAMQCTRRLKRNPRELAQLIIDNLDLAQGGLKSAEIAGPGFINFKVLSDSLTQVITTILNQKEHYGENQVGAGIKINVEYVSANPTGDLHLGHARGAAWGDSLTRIMKASGYDVTREYYVNDAGNQIDNLAHSLIARYKQCFGIEAELPEDGYHGKDVKMIAETIAQRDGDKWLHEDEKVVYTTFRKMGIEFELAKLQKDLDLFRVHFDVWSSEQSLYDTHQVEAALNKLTELGFTYEKDGAIWFKTTQFGDDKDRVLRKTDGSNTYLLPDIAYHIGKYDRGFDQLLNLWGADHHGYIPRMKAAMQALGKDPQSLQVDIIQMVRLVEDGLEVKMSKRTGNAITVRELCEEVGVDAVRYNFVQRALDTHLDFDIGLARKQSNDNPVYYAQYAHARICSILRQAPSVEVPASFDRLTHEKEIALMKYLNEFPTVVGDVAKNRSVHKLCNYIQKCAQHFHSFYGSCKVIDLEDMEMTAQRLALLSACKITLCNALSLIGVEALEKM